MELHRNQHGSSLTGLDWLDQHHAIKIRQRSALIKELSFAPGESVLDLGCASGAWTFLVADQVGLSGTVVGIDSNAEAIARARERLDFRHPSSIEFIVGGIEACPQKVDCILLFNVLSYVQNPLELVVSCEKFLADGGRILIKDSDIGSNFYWPIPPPLYSKVLEKILEEDLETHFGEYDPGFARKLPGILASLSTYKVSTHAQSMMLTAPLTPIERDYVLGNVAVTNDLLLRASEHTLAEQWRKLFSSDNPECVLDEDGFLFSVNEFVFQLKAP